MGSTRFVFGAALLSAWLAVGSNVAAIEADPAGDVPSGKPQEEPAGSLQHSGTWHRMTATVISIDPDDGTVAVDSEVAPLVVSFSPEEMRDLKHGEIITIQMAFAKDAATTGQRAYDAPVKPDKAAPAAPEGAVGLRTLMGTVRDLDRETGVFTFDNAGKMLKLHFPPAELRDVKDGDQITVHLAFHRNIKLTDAKSIRLASRIDSARPLARSH